MISWSCGSHCTNIPIVCGRVRAAFMAHTKAAALCSVAGVCCLAGHMGISLSLLVATRYHVLSTQLCRCSYAWHSCCVCLPVCMFLHMYAIARVLGVLRAAPAPAAALLAPGIIVWLLHPVLLLSCTQWRSTSISSWLAQGGVRALLPSATKRSGGQGTGDGQGGGRVGCLGHSTWSNLHQGDCGLAHAEDGQACGDQGATCHECMPATIQHQHSVGDVYVLVFDRI